MQHGLGIMSTSVGMAISVWEYRHTITTGDCTHLAHTQGFIWGGGGETRVCFPPKKTCFPPKIIWQNNGNYGIALFLITLQVLLSLVVLLKYMMWVLKAKAGL